MKYIVIDFTDTNTTMFNYSTVFPRPFILFYTLFFMHLALSKEFIGP